MMENVAKYEEYAGVIEKATGMYVEKIDEAMSKCSTIATNLYYNDRGKALKRQKVIENLDGIGQNLTNISREAVFRFLNDYKLTIPSDGKDHQAEIENALRIINMLGQNLDARNLENALRPLRSDFRSLKVVLDVLDQKIQSGLYNYNVRSTIVKYTGINEDVISYMDQFGNLVDLLDDVNKPWYGYNIMTIGNSVTMSPRVGYEILSLPDTIRGMGGRFDPVSKKLSDGFGSSSDMDILRQLAR